MATNQSYPLAYQGFAAVVAIPQSALGSLATANLFMRAKSFDVKLSQEIKFETLIDGVVDRTAYSLGMQKVAGKIGFPLIHEGTGIAAPTPGSGTCGTGAQSPASIFWQLSAARDTFGRLNYYFPIQVAYPDNTQVEYQNCVVDSFSLTVSKEEAINVDMNVVGSSNLGNQNGAGITSSAGYLRLDGGYPTSSPAFADYASVAPSFPTASLISGLQVGATPNFLAPARIVTWNDFVISFFNKGTSVLANGATSTNGNGILEFSVDLKNNVKPYATLNGTLVPQDVAAGKREISGDIKILGRNEYLNYMGLTNQYRATSNDQIAFGYQMGANSSIYWATALNGIIYEIEEMSINPENVFETSVKYTALSDCAVSYDATALGTSSIGTSLSVPSATSVYGGSTRTVTTPSAFTGW